jgi:hypothetical protein
MQRYLFGAQPAPTSGLIARELVGQVFAQQYQPRMAAGSELDADGWFT